MIPTFGSSTSEPPVTVTDTFTSGSQPEAELAEVEEMVELPALLTRAASGLQFIYHALEVLVVRYGLEDAAVVVRQPSGPPQVFRRGRVPLLGSDGPPDWIQPALDGRPGLYCEPAVVGPIAASFFTHLVELALRLDLLDHDASHDPLTGLLNRRSYELLLVQAIGRAQRYGWPFALVLLDLDDFKIVNDRYGHAAGDAALRAVGTEVRSALRSGDVAARLGGDEFALLVVGIDNAGGLRPLTERLQAALHRAVPEAKVGFSVGVACFPGDTDEPGALMALADQRLYVAKSAVG